MAHQRGLKFAREFLTFGGPEFSDEEINVGVQGHALNPEKVNRIAWLLEHTEMTVPEIAVRMHCSRSAVLSINRRFQIRQYLGLRSIWEKSQRASQEPSSPRGAESSAVGNRDPFAREHPSNPGDPGNALEDAADYIREIVHAEINTACPDKKD